MIGLGSTTQLGIGIAVRLHDQFSAQAAKINAQLLAMRKNTNSAVMGAMRDYRNQSATIAGGAALVTAGMYQVAKVAADYDHIINQISIVGGKGLGKTRKELDLLAQSLSKMFPGYMPKDVATGMLENVRAGVSGNLDLITKYQLAVGQATGEAVGGEQGVAAGLLGIMNAMDIQGKDFPRVANAVAQAANISMASVYSLNESMQYFANTAHIAGLSLEETLALIARLSQVQIRGSIAGTSLSNMIRHATQSVGMFQSPKNKKAWAALGLSADSVVEMINQGKWFDLIDMVDRSTQGMKRQPKLALLDQIFGVRGEKALINMFGQADPNKTFRALKESITAGVREGIAPKQAAAMGKDVWADFRRIGVAAARMGIKFLHAAEPTLRVLLGIAERVINVFNAILDTPVGKVLAGIVVVAAPLVTILFAFRAAVMTATMALNFMARSASVGGFGSLVQGGLGMAGSTRLGPLAGQVRRNAAGSWIVKKGAQVNIGGQLYKGGQLLPKGFWNMGASVAGGAAAGAAGGIASKAGSFFGKAGGWIGKIGGFGMKWLPVIGWIFTGVEMLKGIFEIQKGLEGGDKYRAHLTDPVLINYYRHLDQQLLDKTQGTAFYDIFNTSMSSWEKMRKDREKSGKPMFSQDLQINLDGTPIFNQYIKQGIDNAIDKELNFELPGQ